jgi:hypothetical protein
MVTVALPKEATFPRLQITVPFDGEQLPCDEVAELNVTPEEVGQ